MKKHFVVQYLLIFLVLLGCNKAPALLEATQTDFTWQTVQITAKGAIAQVARVNLAAAPVTEFSTPKLFLRLGFKGSGGGRSYQATLTARASLASGGTAEITLLDPETFVPLVVGGTVQRFTGTLNTIAASVVKTVPISLILRPCLMVKWNLTSDGATFTRSSDKPICLEPPVDLEVKLSLPASLKFEAFTGSSFTMTFPVKTVQSSDQVLRNSVLTIDVPNVADLEVTNALSNNNTCSTTVARVTCTGFLKKNIEIRFTTPSTPQTIPVRADFSASNPETNLANNTVQTVVHIVTPRRVDIALTWQIPATIFTNQPFAVRLLASNIGIADSTDRTLTLRLPSTTAAPPECANLGGLFKCVLPPLSPNGTRAYDFMVTPLNQDTISFIADLETGADTLDPYINHQNVQATRVATINPASITDLSLTLTATPEPALPDAGQVFSATITNLSNVAAHNVVLTFNRQNWTVPNTCVQDANDQYKCSLGTLAAQSTTTLSLINPRSENQAVVTHYAYLETSSPQLNTNNDYASYTTNFPTADLAVQLTSSPSPITPNAGQTYTVTVSNSPTASYAASSPVVAIFYDGLATINTTNLACTKQIYPPVGGVGGSTYFECAANALPIGSSQTILLTVSTAEPNQSGRFSAYVYGAPDSDEFNNSRQLDWNN